MKVAALNALQQMDEAKARPILRRVLARRDAASACLRRKAVFLVAQQNEPGTEDLLLESVRTDPDPEVQQQAVFWLSQVGTDRAVVALDSILRFSKDPEIQDKAVFALSQHNSPKAQQALRTYAERAEVPDAVKEKAIFWLGQNREPENAALPPLPVRQAQESRSSRRRCSSRSRRWVARRTAAGSSASPATLPKGSRCGSRRSSGPARAACRSAS